MISRQQIFVHEDSPTILCQRRHQGIVENAIILARRCSVPGRTMIGILNPSGIISNKKSTSKHLFWCFRLSQMETSIQCLEGPRYGLWFTDFSSSGNQLWFIRELTLVLQGTDFGSSGNRLWSFALGEPILVLHSSVLLGTDFGPSHFGKPILFLRTSENRLRSFALRFFALRSFRQPTSELQISVLRTNGRCLD